jgi:hypothetical protein
MGPESGVSCIFPLLGSVFSRHLASLLRVPFGFGSPFSKVLPRCSATCCPVRPRFVSFAWLVPRIARCCSCSPSLSRPPRVRLVLPTSWPGLFVLRSAPFPLLFRGVQQASQVRGKTLTRMPCSTTPADFHASPLSALPCCLPLPLRRRLLPFPDFGALSHGLLVRCLRFAVPAFPDPQRKTRFRLVANLCRTGLSPVGSSSKGFRSISLHLAFSFPTLTLAHRGSGFYESGCQGQTSSLLPVFGCQGQTSSLLPVFFPWQPATVEWQTGVRGQLLSAQS